jgi:chemotaxis signal transduction protein
MSQVTSLLVFRIAGIALAVPAQSVASIVMPPAHLTHPPGSSKSSPGIFRHAEHVHSVIDLHARLGIKPQAAGGGRFLLYHEATRHYAFLVDEVVGLVDSEQGHWASLPPYLPRKLFWSGFLYRDEIVLCTELASLRAMHDAEPLRRHLEQVRSQQQEGDPKSVPVDNTVNSKAASSTRPAPPPKTATNTAGQTNQKPAAAPPASSTTSTAAHRTSSASAQSVPTSPKPLSPGRPDKVATTQKSTSVLAANRGRTADTAPAKPAPRSRAGLTESSQRQAADAPDFTYPNTTHASETLPEKSTSSSGHPLLWLALLALLLTAPALWYWWPDSSTPTPHKTPPWQSPPASPPVATLPPPPVEPARPSPAVQVAPPVPDAAILDEDEDDSVVTHDAPLRIERDESGEIHLIIEREALLRHQPEPPPTPRFDTLTLDHEMPTPDVTTNPVMDEDEPVRDDQPESTVAEAEADWFDPARVPPEPCECLHIVVRGDTLWSIARRYTGNAYNYPLLAKQSGIHNPDLIYPGDRIRITIR